MQADVHKNEMRGTQDINLLSFLSNKLLIFGMGDRQRLTLLFNAVQGIVKKLFGSFFMLPLRLMPYAWGRKKDAFPFVSRFLDGLGGSKTEQTQ